MIPTVQNEEILALISAMIKSCLTDINLDPESVTYKSHQVYYSRQKKEALDFILHGWYLKYIEIEPTEILRTNAYHIIKKRRLYNYVQKCI